MTRIRRGCAVLGFLGTVLLPNESVRAQSAPQDQSASRDWNHPGLLRARDLTPFGLNRLDMLPAHTVDARQNTWAFELQTAYQNTFVLSDNVREYLEGRGTGRIALRPEDAEAILDLPSDAYYVDGEIGLIDLVIHRRMSGNWTAYLTVPYLIYGRGAFDTPIESFHEAIGFGQQGRDLVARHQFQFVYRVGDSRFALLDRHTEGGFGDPVIGVRYSLPSSIDADGALHGWDAVLEAAVKVAVDGERFLLSTGKHDFGLQATFQRSWGRHTAYLAGSAVYYAGGPENPAERSQLIPTLILGYGFGLTRRSSLVLQGYASRSTVQDAEVKELTANKYQLSFGIQVRRNNLLWSVALTENISNFGNTPDVGAQLGVAYMPQPR